MKRSHLMLLLMVFAYTLLVMLLLPSCGDHGHEPCGPMPPLPLDDECYDESLPTPHGPIMRAHEHTLLDGSSLWIVEPAR